MSFENFLGGIFIGWLIDTPLMWFYTFPSLQLLVSIIYVFSAYEIGLNIYRETDRDKMRYKYSTIAGIITAVIVNKF